MQRERGWYYQVVLLRSESVTSHKAPTRLRGIQERGKFALTLCNHASVTASEDMQLKCVNSMKVMLPAPAEPMPCIKQSVTMALGRACALTFWHETTCCSQL
eukprot:4269402-Amphidinium_carterae.1